MRFSIGELDVSEKVGVAYFFVFGDGVLGDKEYGIGPFNAFEGETGFNPTLCQLEKTVCCGDFSSYFFRSGSESLER